MGFHTLKLQQEIKKSSVIYIVDKVRKYKKWMIEKHIFPKNSLFKPKIK